MVLEHASQQRNEARSHPTSCHWQLILLEVQSNDLWGVFIFKGKRGGKEGGCTANPQFKEAGRQNEDILIIKIKSEMAQMHFPPMMREYRDQWKGENSIFYLIGCVPRSHSSKKSTQFKLNPSQLKDGVASPPASLRWWECSSSPRRWRLSF